MQLRIALKLLAPIVSLFLCIDAQSQKLRMGKAALFLVCLAAAPQCLRATRLADITIIKADQGAALNAADDCCPKGEVGDPSKWFFAEEGDTATSCKDWYLGSHSDEDIAHCRTRMKDCSDYLNPNLHGVLSNCDKVCMHREQGTFELVATVKKVGQCKQQDMTWDTLVVKTLTPSVDATSCCLEKGGAVDNPVQCKALFQKLTNTTSWLQGRVDLAHCKENLNTCQSFRARYGSIECDTNFCYEEATMTIESLSDIRETHDLHCSSKKL